jgi:hemerythrin-like metal-binding protein
MSDGAGRYAVGEASIDRLHDECEAMIARLDTAIASGGDAGVELECLREHLARHFAHEESLMVASSFPPASCHQREHASVLEVVVEVQRRYAGGERAPAERLVEAIVEWFGIHAGSMDAALAGWLAAPQPATPAASPASPTAA